LLAAFFILNKGGKVEMVGIFQGWNEMRKTPPVYLYLLSLILFVGSLSQTKLKTKIMLLPILRRQFYSDSKFYLCRSPVCLYLNRKACKTGIAAFIAFLLFCLFYAGSCW